jgi:AcrR family transcriptional regulator
METRKRIVEATRRLIQTRGLARVTTKEIAREAGCAEGTLYKHFEHKDDLFLAVILGNFPKLAGTLDVVVTRKGDLARDLRQVALAAIAVFEELMPPAVALFADAELLRRHRDVIHERNGGPKVMYERVASYIKAEQTAGRIARGVDPLAVASLILGPCFQWVFSRQALGENPLPITDEDFVRSLVATLISGIAPKKKPHE